MISEDFSEMITSEQRSHGPKEMMEKGMWVPQRKRNPVEGMEEDKALCV